MSEITGMAVFCDDIRTELGGKVSYMGIYGQDMVVFGPGPVQLPKFCIATHLRLPSEIERTHIRVLVLQTIEGGDREVAAMEADVERPVEVEVSPDTFTQLIFHLALAPFRIEADCQIRVRVLIDEELLKIGTLPIRFSATSPEMTN